MISTFAHELLESSTDPLFTTWYGRRGEVADLCHWNYAPNSPDPAPLFPNLGPTFGKLFACFTVVAHPHGLTPRRCCTTLRIEQQRHQQVWFTRGANPERVGQRARAALHAGLAGRLRRRISVTAALPGSAVRRRAALLPRHLAKRAVRGQEGWRAQSLRGALPREF